MTVCTVNRRFFYLLVNSFPVIKKSIAFEGGKVHLGGKRTYAFVGCDFATGTDFQVWSNITIDGCTVDDVAVTESNVSALFAKLDMTKLRLNNRRNVGKPQADK